MPHQIRSVTLLGLFVLLLVFFPRNVFSQANPEKCYGTWEGDVLLNKVISGKVVVDVVTMFNKEKVQFQVKFYDNNGNITSKDFYNGDYGYLGNKKLHYCTIKYTTNMLSDNKKKVKGSMYFGLKHEETNAPTFWGLFVPEKETTDYVPVEWHLHTTNSVATIGNTNNDVLYMDFDAVEDFREGFAITKKGATYGILKYDNTLLKNSDLYAYNMGINKGGKTDILEKACGFYNGITLIKDTHTGKYGYMDSIGNIIVPCILTQADHYEADGYAYGGISDFEHSKFADFYFDKSGKRYQTPKGIRSVYFTKIENAIDKTTTFYRKNGTKAFETKFKLNGLGTDYGQGYYFVNLYEGSSHKTGFMDTTGKLKIPMTLTGVLSPFSEGLALYEPSGAADFKYGFIDKNGTPGIQLVNDNNIQFSKPESFRYGKADCEIKKDGKYFATLIDKDGNLTVIEDVFKQSNPQYFADLSKVWQGNYNFKYLGRDQFGLFVKCKFAFEPGTASLQAFPAKKESGTGGVGTSRKFVEVEGIGMLDYTGKVIIPPIFYSIGNFDPVSGLAKATMYDSRQNLVQGFINKSGIFVYLLKRKIENF